ncbi:MAG: alpha/beta fold hydrolase [Gammaproteobacteria bacterium]
MPHARINGAKLWYEVRGQGEPILLHHGYTASRLNWMPVAHRLQRMLDHLDIDRVTFAGHSMGGGIGYLLGLDHPDRLERLILMAPIPAEGVGEITPELRAQRIEERRRGDRDAILARYRAMRFRDDVETEAWFESRAEHILSVSDGHFERGAESMQALHVVDRLGDLTTPTLMIAGAVDSLLVPNLLDFMRLPNATLEVIMRAGHEVAVHEPERVAEAITGFMTYGPVTAATLMARLTAEGQ